jgi:hypothetical protein
MSRKRGEDSQERQDQEEAVLPRLSGQRELHTAVVGTGHVGRGGSVTESPLADHPGLVVHPVEGPVGHPDLGPAEDAALIAVEVVPKRGIGGDVRYQAGPANDVRRYLAGFIGPVRW